MAAPGTKKMIFISQFRPSVVWWPRIDHFSSVRRSRYYDFKLWSISFD